MKICSRLLFLSVACVGVCSLARGETPMEERRALYDLGAVSPQNPVIARVDACRIKITANEFKGYLDSLERNETWGVLSLENKKKLLESLLDEHFLLWKGYEEHADQGADIQSMLNQTKKMLMRETLIEQEVIRKEKSPADYLPLKQALVDQLFNQTDILVLADGYEQLKIAAKQLNAPSTTQPAATQGADAAWNAIPVLVRLLPLAKSAVGTVSVGEFLAAYLRIDPAKRPDLHQHEAVAKLLKEVIEDDLLYAEAKRLGLDKAPIVREKLQMNRNVMTRMHVIDELTAQADAGRKRSGFEGQVKEWYQKHLQRKYTYFEPRTHSWVVMAYPQYHEEIQNDYMDALIYRVRREAVAEMRKGKRVDIDEGALDRMELRGPLPSSLPENNLE